MTRRLNPIQQTLLRLIADAGGSFIPSEGSDPIKIKALDAMAKPSMGHLTVEVTDAGNRYHLTTLGRANA